MKDVCKPDPVGTLHLSSKECHTSSSTVEVFECDECGALISFNGKSLHTEWHDVWSKTDKEK